MKTILSSIFLVFIMFQTLAQETKDNETSNAELFSSKPGVLLKLEFIKIGKLKNAEVKVIHYTDMNSTEKRSAVNFEYEVASANSTDTKSAIIDADEIDGLMKSIKVILEKIFSTNPTNYTEVRYTCRGGFETGCYYSKGDWKTYIKLEKNDSKSIMLLDAADFITLYGLLQNAQSMMH